MKIEELEETLRDLDPEELGQALDAVDDLTVSLRTELLEKGAIEALETAARDMSKPNVRRYKEEIKKLVGLRK